MSKVLFDFGNTQKAFEHKSNIELKKARILFKSFGYSWLLKTGPFLVKIAVFIGLKGIIKKTIYKQFVGGETIADCKNAMNLLKSRNVGTILDYSVEGEAIEDNFDKTAKEVKETILLAANTTTDIPFTVFKTTGIGSMELLEKISSGRYLDENREEEYGRLRVRFESICALAAEKKVRIFVDAEESWIQRAIDTLTEEMMAKYNVNQTIVYNTIQLYRKDRLTYLKEEIRTKPYLLGFKLVRGAYMEKEANRAEMFNYENPIHSTKLETDKDFNEAVEFCLNNIEKVSICIGTHNEESSKLCAEIMEKKGIDKSDTRIYFAQLYGMSDNISFNLSDSGYKVAKYLPFGPVLSVVPYLTRRAQENTSAAGQAGRELSLINNELKRRKLL